MAAPTSLPNSRALLVLSSLAHFVNDGTTFFVPVLAALMVPLRGFSPLEVTVFFVLYYVSASLLGLFIGWWSDRHGRAVSLMGLGVGLLGVGLFTFFLVLAGLLPAPFEYPVALLAGVLTGFATSFYHPLGASLLQRSFEPAERGMALGINGAMGSLGRALFPFLFFLVTLALVTTDSILLFVGVALVSAVVIAWGTRSVSARGSDGRGPSSGRARDATTGGIVRLTVVAFVRSVALQGVAVWIPTYLTVARNVPASGQLGLAVTTMYVGGILGQPLFGLAADRTDRRFLIGGSSAGAALATLGYLFSTGWTADLLLFTIGFFTFSAFPLLMTLSADYVPSGSSSLANALVFGLGAGGGGVVGPLVVGAMASGGYRFLATGLEVMAGLGLVAAVCVVFLPAGGRGRPRSLFG